MLTRLQMFQMNNCDNDAPPISERVVSDDSSGSSGDSLEKEQAPDKEKNPNEVHFELRRPKIVRSERLKCSMVLFNILRQILGLFMSI